MAPVAGLSRVPRPNAPSGERSAIPRAGNAAPSTGAPRPRPRLRQRRPERLDYRATGARPRPKVGGPRTTGCTAARSASSGRCRRCRSSIHSSLPASGAFDRRAVGAAPGPGAQQPKQTPTAMSRWGREDAPRWRPQETGPARPVPALRAGWSWKGSRVTTHGESRANKLQASTHRPSASSVDGLACAAEDPKPSNARARAGLARGRPKVSARWATRSTRSRLVASSLRSNPR